MTLKHLNILISLVLFSLCLELRAQSTSNLLKLYIENDSQFIGGPGSDRAYSNGVKLSYIFAKGRQPFWSTPYGQVFDFLDINQTESTINYGLSIGHQIYTPEDRLASNLIADDRPYSAQLYVGFSSAIHLRNHLHLWDLQIGTVGPSAMGEEIQNEFHRLIRDVRLQGWRHQIKDEPIFQLYYEHRYTLIEQFYRGSRYFDLIPLSGLALGNSLLAAHIGAITRIGYQIDKDFGPSRPSSSEVEGLVNADSLERQIPYSAYLFSGARGSAIGRNIHLDGNSFRESHKVDRIPFVGEWEFGATVSVYQFTLTWRRVQRGPEFKERRNNHSFASMSLDYNFSF